jgi:tRNA (cytidine/uridine-2'-O-)-methyltransferase
VFEIILYEPEIPPNTGNVMRLCANTGCRLHLVRPLGFALSDKRLQRAGMDYLADIDCTVHDNWEACRSALSGRRLFALTTRGTTRYDQVAFMPGDVFVFGPETRGLPAPIIDGTPPDCCLFLPMRPRSRSINLANAVAVVVYEAWRQTGFTNC